MAVKSLMLLMLGLTLLRAVAGWKIPKARNVASQTPKNCSSLEQNTVSLDIRILRNNQGSPTSPNINNRSTSPWDYNITQDINRFPSSIAEAQCRSLVCVDSNGNPNNFMNSVPIHQEILVLRRDPQGCAIFRLERIRVAVGCTCVTPLVQHSN
ncbi:PREDICTED: interleukin-17F [Elephantulus edwardii]|uniref:interleukin-17F n=1 Tax=Elephantulus edwardii TaxID=28737 RepID=UPI0003F0A436|nr:PREDICTED: interleukin-17F [Elephantulus edwardii]